jgi:hypothetical protein
MHSLSRWKSMVPPAPIGVKNAFGVVQSRFEAVREDVLEASMLHSARRQDPRPF